ncbi:SDR family oxidoreductase [Rhodococcus sp. D2-41]|uniref:SDR family oxidoreductase n=1 Tax=Speluncibacter jeojiensis TaxID=2710754 RepID=A0A9X4M1B4_9ACTN|nr:SDR family oxidoreductase [Rhodococcus sp. D2-41]MDG3011677.1 SDR family oxidoreductase [Rhodococcus sp. D2-41]MDG3014969.1 SDR family oxidoreductase [Corynebacteriales bacterium D3-21]
MGTLDGKIALITGAGQGVGQGIAFALAKEGAAIAVVGRTESKLVDTCEAIAGFGSRAVPITCDVSDGDQITAAVAATVEQLGGVDILVNNANQNALGALLDIDPHRMEKVFATGPVATLRLMQACHPHMKARGGGAIVNMISSAAVRWDTSGYGVYAAAKEAMRSLTRTAASEWGVDAIRVNAVAPHALSPGLKWWTETNPEEAAEFVKTIPLGRIGDCEQDIGRAVAFLVGPDARYLTGAVMPLDGGQARWC